MFVAVSRHWLMKDETFSQAAAEATGGSFSTLIKENMLCQSSSGSQPFAGTCTLLSFISGYDDDK